MSKVDDYRHERVKAEKLAEFAATIARPGVEVDATVCVRDAFYRISGTSGDGSCVRWGTEVVSAVQAELRDMLREAVTKAAIRAANGAEAARVQAVIEVEAILAEVSLGSREANA